MMSTPSAYTSLICADAAGEYCASSHLVIMDVKRCDSSADTPRLCSSSRTFSLVRLATKENVREELHKRGVSSEDSQRFTDIITRCDEAQYSPVESARMNDVYSEGVNLISRIESVIKR